MPAGSKGMRDGFRPAGWKNFTPRIDCSNANFGGLGTPPVLGTGGYVSGRYLYMPDQRLCMCDFSLVFGGTGNAIGGGTQNAIAGVYYMELPVPARAFDVVGAPGTGAAGDRQIGNGWVGQGNGSGTPVSPQIPVVYTVADFPSITYGGPPNKWMQAFVPYALCNGTGTIPITASSLAVSFPYTILAPTAAEISVNFTSNPTTLIEGTGTLGTGAATIAVSFPKTLTYTPSAADINIEFTSNATKAGQLGPIWLTSISTTGFTLNAVVSPTTNATFSYSVNGLGAESWISGISGTGFTLNLPSAPTTAATFTYKVRVDTGTLMNAAFPFNVGGTSGDAIRGHLYYETAT